MQTFSATVAEEAAMIVADVVIQTQPGRAPAVEAHLEKAVPGFQSRRIESDCIHGSWCAPSGQGQALAEVLRALDADILDVNPTLLGVIGE
jgi:hypothetical protein